MRLLTRSQKKRIRALIKDHHLALRAELCGADSISSEEYDRLVKEGKLKKQPSAPLDLVTAAHLLGGLLDGGERLQPTSFWEMARHHEMVTSVEHEAVELAKEKVGNLVQAMSAKAEQSFAAAAHDADATMRRQKMFGVIATGLSSKSSAAKIAEHLAKVTGDLKRDWMRTAHTEVHNLIEEGKAIALMKLQPDEDPLVYKQPHPDACPYCKLLYLKPNGVPRVFKLSVLIANGSNVGRKAGRPSLSGAHATSYKATLDAMHPWCKCELRHLPAHTKFDDQGKLVTALTKAEALDSLAGLEDLLQHTCVDA